MPDELHVAVDGRGLQAVPFQLPLEIVYVGAPVLREREVWPDVLDVIEPLFVAVEALLVGLALEVRLNVFGELRCLVGDRKAVMICCDLVVHLFDPG